MLEKQRQGAKERNRNDQKLNRKERNTKMFYDKDIFRNCNFTELLKESYKYVSEQIIKQQRR